MATDRKVGLSAHIPTQTTPIPTQTTPELAADAIQSPTTDQTVMAKPILPAEQQSSPGMLDRLRELGYTVIELTPTDPVMGRAITQITGMTSKKLERTFATAFNDPEKANTILREASKAAQAAIARDKGEIVATSLRGSKPYRRKPTIVACGVDEEGKPFLAAHTYSGKKHAWQNYRREKRRLLTELQNVGVRPADRNGITANLLPKNQLQIERLAKSIFNPPKQTPRKPTSKRGKSPTPLTDALAQLDKDAIFTATQHGYTLPEMNHVSVMLDPEGRDRTRMVRIARLARTLGKSALGLRWRAGRRAAILFAERPEIWQSLVHIAGGLEGQIAQGTASRNARALLIEEARRKLAEVQAGEEPLPTEQLATLTGASLLAKYSKRLRDEISGKLAARHMQPAALPRPEKPQKPPRIGLLRRIFNREAKEQHIRNEAMYAKGLRRYKEQLAAFQANQRELGNYPATHEQLTRNGGQILQHLLSSYAARSTRHIREGVFFWDSNSKWSFEDVAAAIITPSRLPELFKRVQRERSADKKQVWEHVYGLVKKFGKSSLAATKAIVRSNKSTQTTAAK